MQNENVSRYNFRNFWGKERKHMMEIEQKEATRVKESFVRFYYKFVIAFK